MSLEPIAPNQIIEKAKDFFKKEIAQSHIANTKN